MLRAEEISKNFGLRKVLQKVNITLERGRVRAVIGPNGAGKTTLIRILSTLIKANSGKIFLDGEEVTRKPQILRKKIGLVSHHPLLYLELSPLENLQLFSNLYGVSLSEEELKEKLNEVGLLSFAYDDIRFFSRGMIQRLAIAKALIHQPELILFDEPFAGLDIKARTIVLDFLQKARREKKAILLVSHDVELAYSVADDFLLLFGGKIVERFSKKEISLRELIKEYKKRLEGT